ncbi:MULTISPECIES: peptidoglycan recognition protein family protein [Clostridia]|uniref:peptidoglycan recognition protein family protein n=1 Tax=Clostridia TaxID=186801 RepID=UPI001FAB0D0C|nr:MULTISPECIES: peptidoglycan recognition family protein [Clostridia]
MQKKKRKSNQSIKKYHRKSRRNRTKKLMIIGVILLIVILGIGIMQRRYGRERQGHLDVDASQPDIDVQLLDINEYSRPGIESDSITGIVIHYTANPGSTAQQNRNYFNGLKDSHETSVSSHFVVGLEGEIIQCVPTWEIAYASNERNHDTVSIECCHPDETGKFNDETYKSVVQLTAFLCEKYGLTQENVIRHYDVTGKICPKYFVEHEDAWQTFKEDVEAALQKDKQK